MATSSIGSAIDVQGIVSQLMSVERQPLQKLQTSASGIQTKLSAIGRVQGGVSALQSAAQELTNLPSWRAVQATSSNETAAKATAATGAAPGTYDLTVNQLAQRQTLAGPTVASADTVVGGGTLSIQLGTYEAGTNSFSSTKAVKTVTIPAGSTLAQVRDTINATSGTGISATIVNDGNGSRLVLRTAETGSSNTARILVADSDGIDTDAAGLSSMAFDPTAAAGSGRNLIQTQAAQDASVTISGLTVTSPTNSVNGAIENVSLDLRQAGTGSLTVTVSANNSAMRGMLDRFVNAWNDLNRILNDVTRYDPATKVAGPLQGDNTVLGLQRQLKATLGATLGGGDLTRLSDAGLAVQRDGSLQINAARLEPLMATPSKLSALFAGSSDTNPSLTGIARRLTTLTMGILANDGAVTASTNALRSRQTSIQEQQARLQTRLTQIEQRLTQQYSAVNENITKINSAAGSLVSKFG
jgi:flagellar hook-associated protein 2